MSLCENNDKKKHAIKFFPYINYQTQNEKLKDHSCEPHHIVHEIFKWQFNEKLIDLKINCHDIFTSQKKTKTKLPALYNIALQC